MSISPTLILVIVLFIILIVKKGGGLVKAFAPVRGMLPPMSWKGGMYIALAVFALSAGMLFFMGVIAVPGKLPGTEWVIRQNMYETVFVILALTYAGSYFLGDKSGKALRFVCLAGAVFVFVFIFAPPSYQAYEAKQDRIEAAQRAAQAARPVVQKVCGVTNTRPEYADYQAGDHDAPWHTNEMIIMPRSINETECAVTIMWDEADPSVHGTFEMQCRGTIYLPWGDPVDPYGKTPNCNLFRLRSKGTARNVRFKFFARPIESATN